MHNSIQYIANNDKILPTLKQYFLSQKINLIEYSVADRPQSEFLLIVEPFRIEKELYSISTAWKPWLFEYRPNTKLIVAAYAQSAHTNCLNLLDLPNDLNTWLGKTQTVSTFPLQEIKEDLLGQEDPKYTDPWAFDLIKPGNELNQQMRKFVDGHEKSKSLFAQIAQIRKALQDLNHNKKNKNSWKKDTEHCLDLWNYFSHRWSYYSKVFAFVPYQEAISTIRENVEKLKKGMETAEQDGIYPDIEALDTLIDTMNKEMLPYIFPEKYW